MLRAAYRHVSRRSQVHKARYGENLLSELPPADKLPAIARSFFGAPTRSSSRFSAADLITAASLAGATPASGKIGGQSFRPGPAAAEARPRVATLRSLKPEP